jgi:hypothetical protein
MNTVVSLFPDADEILRQAIGRFDDVLVVGWSRGDLALLHLESTDLSNGDILWLIEKLKLELLNEDDVGLD